MAISPLSCIYKVYSGILNNRLVLYFEDLNWFADEQNGFRKKNRSRQDHAYILNSIVKNRQSENLHTYAAFVDMQKAFDWLDRDLLMLKLLMNNISGKIYRAIKSIYSGTISSIHLGEHMTGSSCNARVRQGDVLSGVPDLWDRNKILRCGDLSHLHVPDCIWVLFCLICDNSSQFSILFWIMYYYE